MLKSEVYAAFARLEHWALGGFIQVVSSSHDSLMEGGLL